ncbi:MAG: hypothetical protein LJF04_18420 [Gemmatimonadetes bacterium]|nr:hypothetical protein [Gemmatimonadota bacterium]
MNRFAHVLRQLSERLSLPQPARCRILLEISGDLEELFRSYLEKGLSPEDAEREALSHVDLSDEALEELGRVHGGWFRRFADGLAGRMGPIWERALLVALGLGGVVLGGGVLRAVPMSRAAGLWLVPVAGLALVGLAVGARKAWDLFVRRDHRPVRLRSGLDAIVGLSVLQVFVAFGALWVTAVGAIRGTEGQAPRAVGLMTMHWLQSSLALLVLSLSLAIVVGLVWFFLLMHVVSIERREAVALLGAWAAEE